MATEAALTEAGSKASLRGYGVPIDLFPGNPALPIEIQRATSAAGPWTTAAYVTGVPGQGGTWCDMFPRAGGAGYYYRTRHVGPGLAPGRFLPVMGPFVPIALTNQDPGRLPPVYNDYTVEGSLYRRVHGHDTGRVCQNGNYEQGPNDPTLPGSGWKFRGTPGRGTVGYETTAGGAPVPFGFESFAGAAGATLQTLAPDAGTTWVKHATATADAVLVAAGSAARVGSAGGAALYYLSDAPPSADYAVEADVTYKSATCNVGVYARLSTSAESGYCARLTSTGLELAKFTGGSSVTLGTLYAFTPVAGRVYRMRLTVAGTTLVAALDGVDVITVTDSTYAAAGRAGLRLREASGTPSDATGGWIDNWSAIGTATSGSPLAGSRSLVLWNIPGWEVGLEQGLNVCKSGEWLYLKALGRVSATGVQAQLRIVWLNDAGAEFGASGTPLVGTTAAVGSATVAVPAGAVAYKINPWIADTSTVAGWALLDEIEVQRAPSREALFDDGKGSVRGDADGSGNLDSSTQQTENGIGRPLTKGVQQFKLKDGDPVVYSPPYSAAPKIVDQGRGGAVGVPDSTQWKQANGTPAGGLYSASATTYRVIEVVGNSASGGTLRAWLQQVGSPATNTREFSGTALTTPGQTDAVTLVAAGASDGRYYLSAIVDLAGQAKIAGQKMSVTLVVAIDVAADGVNFSEVQRDSFTLSTGLTTGDNEQIPYQPTIAPGVIGAGAKIQIRVVSISTTGTFQSFDARIRGCNNGAAPLNSHGLTYFTGTVLHATLTPNTGDYVFFTAEGYNA